MNKILITAGTTSIALRVKKLLSNRFNISLGTSSDIPSVLREQYIKLPISSSPSYSHQILKIALDNGFDYVLPLEANEMIELGESLVLFKEYNIEVLVPNANDFKKTPISSTIPKSTEILLLNAGVDLITGESSPFLINGLGILTHPGEEFVLIGL